MSRKVVITEPRNMTISNIFIVPIFKIGRENLVKFGFVNSYLFNTDRNIIYEDYCLHLLFKPENLDEFADFINMEKERLGVLYLDEYDYGDGFVVLVYKIEEYHNEDIKILLMGGYSKLSNTFMSEIPATVRVRTRTGVNKDEKYLAYLIHEKNQGLIDMWENILGQELPPNSEVWSKPTILEETLSEDKLINIKQYQYAK